MNKIKKLFKNRIFLCLFTALLVGSITVKATTYFPSNDVTYDNSESGLSSTDVQGAIDELYTTCKGVTNVGGQEIDIVTEGDGLYKDEYEEGKYTYKGTNPNNYITFNGEMAGWRIISIETNGSLKIIKNNSIGKQWLDGNWQNSDTQSHLNNTYLNTLNNYAKNQIITHDWNIGKDINENPLSPTDIQLDIEKLLNQEKLEKWNGKIGLITISEYIRANSNLLECDSWYLNNQYLDVCTKTNWMYNSNLSWWTLSYFSRNTNSAYVVSSNGNVGYNNASHKQYEVRPVLYLSSDIKIIGGYGTQSNPYRIE